MSNPTQGAVGAETMTAGPKMVLLPMDDPRRPLNDSGLPSVMIWAGGEAYDDLTMPGVAEKALDLDSCALAVGIYRAMTEAHAKEIATLTPPAALALPRTDSDERTAGEGLPFGDTLPDPASEIATQVMNLTWSRYGLTDPRSEVFDHDALGDRHGDVQTIARRVIDATPAQPAGALPDSLQALLKEARDGLAAYTGGPDGACGETITRIDTLLASHPAGQSAGSGAGMKLVPEQPTEAMLNAPLAPGSSITSARYESRRDLRPLIYAAMIGAAPDSTRTGQGEALRSAMIRALDGHTAHSRDCHMSGDYLCQQVWPLVEAALAARPAAPEKP